MFGRRRLTSKGIALLTVIFLLVGSVFPVATFATGASDSVSIAVLGTSDIHGSIMGWDYYKGAESDGGMARLATLIGQEKAKYDNTILVDAGDTIQGSPLTYYYDKVNTDWMKNGQPYPMMDVFNTLEYDAWTLGNHEFNYGLGVLEPIIDTADFPVLSANTLDSATGETWSKVKPYTTKTFKTAQGKDFTVGILGLTTPAIPNWESKENYAGLEFGDIVTEGSKWVDYLKDTEKVDAIVTVIHSGLGDADPSNDPTAYENEVLAFANANPDVNAIVTGHTHSSFATQIGDNKIWTVQSKNGGFGLGEIVMDFTQDSTGKWVQNTTAQNLYATKAPNSKYPGSTTVAEDQEIVDLAADYHAATLEYLKTKVGTTSGAFLADGQTIKDTALMDLVNDIQIHYGNADLSVAAPFSPTAKIPEGDVTIGDISSVYIYENYLYTVKVTGKQLSNWLEWSVDNYYQQYKPGDEKISKYPDKPDYTYDILQGADYTIDLTKSGLWDKDGNAIANGEPRIKNLKYQGQEVKDTDMFNLAINNYRFNGGGKYMEMAGITPQTTDPNAAGYVVFDSQKTYGDDGQVRNLMIKYFEDMSKQGKVINPEVDNNWQTSPRFYDFVEFTDTHGAIDNYVKNGEVLTNGALMGGLVNQERKAYGDDRTVVLAGGDMMQGTPTSNVLRGKPVIDVMNEMKFDAMTLGNHEFDWGTDILDQRVNDAEFPILAANIKQKAGDTDADASKLMADVKPYTIIENKDGLNVGVIGVTTPETSSIVSRSIIDHFEFEDPATVINSLVPQVRAEGADVVVVLAHVGEKEITDLANDVTGVDAIFGGHSHTTNVETINDIPVVIGNKSARGAGTIRLAVDDSNKVIGAVPGYLDIYGDLHSSLTPDAEVQAIVDAAAAELGPIFDEVIGQAEKDLPKVSKSEMALGNWITDVTLAAAPGADFAFQNEGGVRTSIDKGDITVGDIFTVMPFDNEVVTMELTGEDIYALLEQGVSGQKGNIQVSGLKFTYDPNQPEYSRVLSATELDGTPIDRNKTYTIATNDFLAGGQDGYVTFNNGTNLQNTHILVRDAMIDDLKANGTLTGSVDGRAAAIASVPAPTPAASADYVQVTASRLNLRVGPGLDYGIMGSLPRGTNVELVSSENGWAKIKYSGKLYYVKADYVEAVSAEVVKLATVTPKIGLNVRSSADLSGGKLGALPYGTTVQIIGTEGDWYKIIYQGGYGYVYAKYAA